jgi:alkaline phosphatase
LKEIEKRVRLRQKPCAVEAANMKLTTLLLTGVAALGFNSHAFAQQALPQANDAYFKAAQEQLAARLALQPITGKAKNIILMVGDGMGLAMVTASRIYEGQKRGVDGESNRERQTKKIPVMLKGMDTKAVTATRKAQTAICLWA